ASTCAASSSRRKTISTSLSTIRLRISCSVVGLRDPTADQRSFDHFPTWSIATLSRPATLPPGRPHSTPSSTSSTDVARRLPPSDRCDRDAPTLGGRLRATSTCASSSHSPVYGARPKGYGVFTRMRPLSAHHGGLAAGDVDCRIDVFRHVLRPLVRGRRSASELTRLTK